MIELLLMGAVAAWLVSDPVHKAAVSAEQCERREREGLVKKLAELEELERQAARASTTWSQPRSQHRDRGEHRNPKQRREDYQRAKSFLLDWQEGACAHCGKGILRWTGTKIRRGPVDGLEKLWCARCSSTSAEQVLRISELRGGGDLGKIRNPRAYPTLSCSQFLARKA